MASVGSCGKCERQLLIIRWVDGERVLVVACMDCKVEMRFSLDRMLEILGDDAYILLSPTSNSVH